MSDTPTAGLYRRVSTDQQDSANQVEDLEQLCRARGWRWVWYVDEAMSGRRDTRPAYQRLLQDARTGKVQVVVVWKLDRLGRSAGRLAQDVTDLSRWRVRFVSHQDPDFDTTSSMGRFVLGLLAQLAELEASLTGDRTRAAYQTKKARAEAIGQRVRWGRAPRDVPGDVLEDVRAGRLTLRAAEARTGIPRRTIARRLAGQNTPLLDGAPVSPDSAHGAETTLSAQAGGFVPMGAWP